MKRTTSRLLYAYWNDLRGERAAPERGDIQPGAIRHLLADTFVLELDSAGSARFRLAGTRCCALFGRELGGFRFDRLWPSATAADVKSMTATVVDETVGIVAGLHASTLGGREIELELILLPLRHRGKTHARILGALTAATPGEWIGLDSIAALATTSVRVMRPTSIQAGSHRRGEPMPQGKARFVVHQGGLA